MQQGLELKLTPEALARITELRRIVQRGAAAQEELGGFIRRVAVENGVDLEQRADIRIAEDTLVVLPILHMETKGDEADVV